MVDLWHGITGVRRALRPLGWFDDEPRYLRALPCRCGQRSAALNYTPELRSALVQQCAFAPETRAHNRALETAWRGYPRREKRTLAARGTKSRSKSSWDHRNDYLTLRGNTGSSVTGARVNPIMRHWGNKTGAMLLPAVSAPAIHELLVRVEDYVLTQRPNLSPFVRPRSESWWVH